MIEHQTPSPAAPTSPAPDLDPAPGRETTPTLNLMPPGLDAQTAPLPDLETAICGWAGRLAAATCGWLTLIAAFDQRGGWSGVGLRSCAHWLSWRCGIGLRAAREHLATARALEHLPAVRAAFADGMISYSKVRAITRIADPATERLWLEHALHCTAGQLERLVRALRQATNPADHAQAQAARRVSWRTDDEGMLYLTATLPPDEGAQLIAALDAARSSLTTTGTADQPPPDEDITAVPRDRHRDADALLALAEGFLQQPAPGLASPTHTITVHVDATTLLDTTQPPRPTPKLGPRPGSRVEISPGIGLSPAVLRRLGCDGLIRTLLTDPHGNPLRLGRRRRLPTRQLRDAVHARDHGTCQYPGCAHTRWLHIHHLTPWTNGGTTDPDNLTLICGQHHRTLHNDNIELRRTPTGQITAHLPDGRTLHPTPPLNPGAQPTTDLTQTTRHVAPDAITTRDGGPFHLAESVRALLQDHAVSHRLAGQAELAVTCS
ncbi:HNH endonuclease [Parafrankia discariae]|uniref:HNH endonuclease n=1 Tax=Parafrankia discariae TaxID=365528 RepID=UPI000976E4D2|nr:HNH endonuclease signature motif containing protein [Parafrankia discariae]